MSDDGGAGGGGGRYVGGEWVSDDAGAEIEAARAALSAAVERERAGLDALENARADVADAEAALERLRGIDAAVMAAFEPANRVLRSLPAGVQATALRAAGVDVDPWADAFPRLALLLHMAQLNNFGRSAVLRSLRMAGDLVAPVVDGRMLVSLPDPERTCVRIGACRLRREPGVRGAA